MVSQDGVQHQPIHFPSGSHLNQFLTCLENGLDHYSSKLIPDSWADILKFEKRASFILEIVSNIQEPVRNDLNELNSTTKNSYSTEIIDNSNLLKSNFENLFLSPISNFDSKNSIFSSICQLNLTDEQFHLQNNKKEG